MDRIPIEIWGVIAGFLHSRDQCTLLFLSRTLRRAAQGHLFRQLDLYFGLWERIKPSDYSDTPEEDTVDTADSREEMLRKDARRTTEILARIDQDETFAHGIRSLRLMCYTNSGLTKEETELLINAINAMPQLKRFEWLGIFPPLTHQTALALSGTCPQLHDLRIPASQSAHAAARSLQFKQLRSLIIASQLHVDNRDGDSPEAIYEYQLDMQALISSNPNLIRLTIYSNLLEFLNKEIFERLVELEVWGSCNEHLARIQDLIPCGNRLQSLSLVELTGCNAVLPILFSPRDNFPLLTSLKIMSIEIVYHKKGAHALSDFIRSHPNLRRLDFDLPGLARLNLLLILEAVGELSQLQVFGCDFRTVTEIKDLAILAQYLPLSLIAAHLQLCWENVSYTELIMEPVLNRLADMPHLRFLHTQSRCTSPQDEAEELVYTLTGLDYVGLAEQMFTVYRHTSNPTQASLRPWPLRDVALRSATTIGQEGEWLLRFHNLLESTE